MANWRNFYISAKNGLSVWVCGACKLTYNTNNASSPSLYGDRLLLELTTLIQQSFLIRWEVNRHCFIFELIVCSYYTSLHIVLLKKCHFVTISVTDRHKEKPRVQVNNITLFSNLSSRIHRICVLTKNLLIETIILLAALMFYTDCYLRLTSHTIKSSITSHTRLICTRKQSVLFRQSKIRFPTILQCFHLGSELWYYFTLEGA